MAISLLNLEPHKVSRDLGGYITYIYGEPKSGKTTFGSKLPGALILAFEQGYNALPGVYAQDVATWGELKQIVRELKKPDVKEKFHSLIIDTVDIAGTLCEKYVCSQNDVDALSQIQWGQGWNKLKREFEDTFRSITQMGYAVLFISHSKDKTFKRKDGTEYNQVVPTAANSINEIVKNMADIYAYAEKYEENGVGKTRLILRSPDNSADTGCRFKYIKPVIPFEYDTLVNALNEAIDKEASETNGSFITNERNNNIPIETNYDYDALMKEFNQLAGSLMSKNKEYYAPRITQIIEKYLGKGKKVAETSLAQAEFIYLINEEIKSDLV